MPTDRTERVNDAYALALHDRGGQLFTTLTDLAAGAVLADGPYAYRLRAPSGEGHFETERLTGLRITEQGDSLVVEAQIGGFALEHRFALAPDAPALEETVTLHNRGAAPLALAGFSCGFQAALTTDVGHLLPAVEHDRFVAIPFRHRPSDPPEHDNDYSARDLLRLSGTRMAVNAFAALPFGHGVLPSDHWFSEGWLWQRGAWALGVFKFNQAAIEFCALRVNTAPEGARLQFGGATLFGDDAALPVTLAPGDALRFGVTRLVTVRGGIAQASYAFRAFLAQHGCGLPPGFNPPVHWNEIYDNAEYILGAPVVPPGPRLTRALTYTRALILEEAQKAQAYACEALYLDPGWDTDFATFLWGEDWLGDSAAFMREVRERYGLAVSLHCPLAPWLSWDGRGVSRWPTAAYRKARDGTVIQVDSVRAGRVPAVCLGAQAYLDEAERRLCRLCEDGAAFVMFDGNWWQGECWDASHGHPVPYTKEAHCQANHELARRIHARYPHVQIEMHDMITGGSIVRYTPVYYKYGLPGGYDSNWGFELMWQPMEDLRSGKARALYYYNLACEVPIYLHIDLRADNLHALVLWWYASTCRHLGIGGTHASPLVADVHQQAMRRYRALERFFKRGTFYGAGEDVHFHVLADENAFVVNLFNLSDQSRIVTASIGAEEIGIDPERWYVVPYSHAEGGFDGRTGTFRIARRLEPWEAQVAYIHPLEA